MRPDVLQSCHESQLGWHGCFIKIKEVNNWTPKFYLFIFVQSTNNTFFSVHHWSSRLTKSNSKSFCFTINLHISSESNLIVQNEMSSIHCLLSSRFSAKSNWVQAVFKSFSCLLWYLLALKSSHFILNNTHQCCSTNTDIICDIKLKSLIV